MKRNPHRLFIIVLFFVWFLYGYNDILFSRPGYHHAWRQTDCLSITTNYYRENLNFFKPEIHWVGDRDGKTISEFPIIYYSVAQLWKIFGQHEFIFRLLNLLIVLTGLYCLFRFFLEFLSDTFWALFIPFFLFSSPILAYYSNNFMADAPGLGFTLIACYFFWRGSAPGSKKAWYYLSFLFFLLGGLVKISSLIIFFALFIIHLYVIFFRRKEKTWFNRFSRLWPYLVVMVITGIWYAYARDYNYHHLRGIFLQEITPVWKPDKATILRLWDNYSTKMLPLYFTIPALLVDLLIFLGLFFYHKKVNKVLLYLNLLVFMGCVGFILLFYEVLTIHDYYSTNLLIFIPLPVIAGLDLLKRNYPALFRNIYLKLVFGTGTLVLLYVGAITNRMFYDTHDGLVKTNFLVNRNLISETGKFNAWSDERFKALQTITPVLRQLGIDRTDRVLSIPDWSINISLYLMDQKGFSDFFCDNIPYGEKMGLMKKLGCKYIILNDTSLCHDQGLAPYLQHPIGRYENVKIYKLDQ
ncbi:MAG: glycosyltransferase family 39 protein [Bacteroidetes bacterium]|nr:glycosyltransferase family 39 protein [Bacteroidota bacterium]